MKIINNMRRFLGINEVLGIPKPDNFIEKTGRCFNGGVYCSNSTLQN